MRRVRFPSAILFQALITPMYVFEEVLGRPLITIPIVNHDNNQHGANENLRLKNLWNGIEMFGQVLARLGVVWDGMDRLLSSGDQEAEDEDVHRFRVDGYGEEDPGKRSIR